jgi:hypothetical protein
MTNIVLKAPGLKSIRKQCEQINLRKNQRSLIICAPSSAATISSAILCKALLKFGGTFHISFVEQVLEVSSLNRIQKTYSAPTTFIIGVDVFGKKKIRKEKGYPIFIGGTHQSKQANIHSIGNKTNMPLIAYVLAEQKLQCEPDELQLAAIGILFRNKPENIPTKIGKAIVKLAEKEALIEGKKGFKLFGLHSQPLMETMIYSIFPYLSNISGDPETCEKILDDADIPFSKRRMPINELSTTETQRLTKQLIPRLNQATISQVLGQDFIITNERENSPIQTISSIRALALYSWNQWKIGSMFSIWMGDRSRTLRELVDSYLIHSKDVIAGFQDLEPKILQGNSESESTESISIYNIPGVSNTILSDLGRISFEQNLINKKDFLILISGLGIGVIWNLQETKLSKIILELKSVGLNPISSSPKSIRINETSEEVQQTLLNTLKTITTG